MPKRAMDTLTEAMFYVLMALREEHRCGIEIADFVEHRTQNRLLIGPATLYTILGKFEKEGYIREVLVQGRKRTYEITEKGSKAYDEELARLRRCVADAEGG